MDGDIFLLVVFASFCLGLHTPRPMVGGYDRPAAMKGVSKASEPADSNRLRVFIRIQAPDNSPYAWVNHNLFVGVAGASGADRTATLRVYRVL